MDHAEAREILELAAAEPDGLDRLMAGDTLEAAALAGHLAGCEDCSEEMVRLRRTSVILRDVIGTAQPNDLRARTLDYVRAVGRPRAVADAGSAAPSAAIAGMADVAANEPNPRRPTPVPDAVGEQLRDRSGGAHVARRPAPRLRRGVAWVTSLAAVLALAVGLTGILVASQRDATIREQAETVSDLTTLTAWTVRLDGSPDAVRVGLASQAGTGAGGQVIFSPSSREMVVVTTGLQVPAAGQEYRCWLNANGQQSRLGRMSFAGQIQYWVGKADVVKPVPKGSTFGVTLVDAAGNPVPGQPALTGTL